MFGCLAVRHGSSTLARKGMSERLVKWIKRTRASLVSCDLVSERAFLFSEGEAPPSACREERRSKWAERAEGLISTHTHYVTTVAAS